MLCSTENYSIDLTDEGELEFNSKNEMRNTEKRFTSACFLPFILIVYSVPIRISYHPFVQNQISLPLTTYHFLPS